MKVTIITGTEWTEHAVNVLPNEQVHWPDPRAQMQLKLPAGTRLVVLCHRDMELKPFAIRLPHQVYYNDVMEAGAEGLYVLPVMAQTIHIKVMQ